MTFTKIAQYYILLTIIFIYAIIFYEKRIKSIDIAKGIATILVIVGHLNIKYFYNLKIMIDEIYTLIKLLEYNSETINTTNKIIKWEKSIMKIKNIFLYIKHQYKATSKSYYNYLKNKGIKLGVDVRFYSPWTIQVDIQRPWMIEIGNNVHITSGVRILQHGYDWAVLQKMYGEVLGSCGKVKIGNNVFIGVNSTILKGVKIGNNVIIGANSLVNKDCKDNGVYAGNPARYIMSIEDYYEKRKNKQIEEATELVIEYYNKYKKFPSKELLREYFWIFERRNGNICETFEQVINLENNGELTLEKFKNTEPVFDGYEEFLNVIKKNMKIGKDNIE